MKEVKDKKKIIGDSNDMKDLETGKRKEETWGLEFDHGRSLRENSTQKASQVDFRCD